MYTIQSILFNHITNFNTLILLIKVSHIFHFSEYFTQQIYKFVLKINLKISYEKSFAIFTFFNDLNVLFDYLILIFFLISFFYFTVAVKELSGDEYLLRLSMISALQGFLKVSNHLFENQILIFRSDQFFVKFETFRF